MKAALTRGFIQRPSITSTWLWTVIIPRRPLPVGLCAGNFGGVMMVVIGCTKNLARNGRRALKPDR
jgi:hypothetical protein